jgi:O-antigen/teichoic acid export membrane protein
MKTVLLRLSGFAILPLLSLITPLLLLPIVSSIVGANGVSSIVSGQAIGTFAATILLWGWNVEGPVAIARSTAAIERGSIYAQSMRTRLLLSVAVLPLTAVVSAAIAVPAFRVEAISMALASGFAGMSPAWFCIGLGQPKLLAIFDTVPRFLATALSAPLLILSHQVWAYAGVLAVATTFSLWVFHRGYSPGQSWFPSSLGEALWGLRRQRHTAGINIAGSAYATTPAPIATVTSSAAVSGSIASADTLYRLGIFTVVALGNAFQGWAIEPGIANRVQRHRAAVWAHVALGGIGAVIITALGPAVSGLIFAGQARATTLVCLYYGVAFFFLSASTPLIRNLLIPSGRQAYILWCTVISAALGIIAMLVAGLTGNPTAIPLGMALSEIILWLVLILPALRTLRDGG